MNDFIISMDIFLNVFTQNENILKNLPSDVKENFLRVVKDYARLLLIFAPDRGLNYLYRTLLVFYSTICNSLKVEEILKEEDVEMLKNF